MGMLPPILIELKANASELHSKLGEASKEIEKLGADGATHGEKFKAGMKAGMEGAGAAMTGLGGILAVEGIKGTEATTLLETAVKNAGGSMEEMDPKIHSVVGSMANFGHSSSDTETALARLTDATGDPTKALDQMGLVADVAARKHISLTDAANMVGKIDVGKGAKALTDFGITASKSADLTKKLESATKEHETAVDGQSKAVEKLHDLQERLAGKTKLTTAETQALRHAHEDVTAETKKVSDSSQNLTAIQGSLAGATDSVATNLDNLHKKVMGGAQAQADTLGGKLNSLKAHMENIAEAAGQKIGPAMAIAGPALAGVGGAAEAASKIMGHFKSAQEAATVATEGLTVATEEGEVAEGIALAPILLIIGALALVGVAAYELATHWSTVWNGVKMVIGKVWDFIKDTFDKITGVISGVIDWVKDHWPLILGVFLGPFALLIGEVIQHWDTIVGIVESIPGRIAAFAATMWDGIKNAFTDAKNWISDRIGDIVGFFSDLPGKLVDAAGDLFKFIRDKITDARDWVSGRIDDVVGFFTGLPGHLASAAGDLYRFVRDLIVDARDWVSGRIDDVVGFFTGLPGRLASAAGDLYRFVRDLIVDAKNWVSGKLDDIVGFFTGLPGRIKSAAVGMWDGIKDAFTNTLNAVIGMWNNLHIPSFTIGGWDTPFGHLPSFTTPQVNFPDIPGLAAGGIILSDGLAYLHAAEVVSPAPGGGSGGGGDTYVTIEQHFAVPPNVDMAAVGAVAISAIKEYEARNGKTWRAA